MNAPTNLIALKLTRVGNSTGMILPKSLLARLGVEIGDTVTIAETEGGGFELRRSESDFEKQMAVARDVMVKRRRALRELAK